MIETREGYLHEDVLYEEVRGAIIEPVLSGSGRIYPGYYCIFGKTKPESDTGEHYKLRFLAEGESRARDILTAKMLSDARKLFCHTVYVNQTQEGFMYFVAKMSKKFKSDARLSYSPFIQGHNHGVALVADYASKHAASFPKDTTIRSQIGLITPDSVIDESTYSFFALCLLLGGFWIHKGTQFIENFKSRQRKRIREEQLSKLDPASRSAAIELEDIWDEVAEHERMMGDLMGMEVSG